MAWGNLNKKGMISAVIGGGFILALMPINALADEPTVVDVRVTKESFWGGRDFLVSVLHKDEGWKHFADKFEILTVDGEILKTRLLAHPHVDEQPVNRDGRGVNLPEGTTAVLVRGHDNIHGYSKPFRVEIPADGSGVYVTNDGK